MFKQFAHFEKEISGFEGHLNLESTMPLPIAKEMLLYFLKCLGQIEDQAQAALAAQASQETKQESVEEKNEAQVNKS